MTSLLCSVKLCWSCRMGPDWAKQAITMSVRGTGTESQVFMSRKSAFLNP
uniref:Uncharacterized protein n=1 Tax=Utricularia reniformis TaxID=192314 RepID=A0A1Y0B1A0_9LAMI|nr:hypothetical protein AEK19_MT1001 [Utricularia reniformis]ART31225.1 hypothetical protein AEK19_MT1001 [Utricularia reniformis]